MIVRCMCMIQIFDVVLLYDSDYNIMLCKRNYQVFIHLPTRLTCQVVSAQSKGLLIAVSSKQQFNMLLAFAFFWH